MKTTIYRCPAPKLFLNTSEEFKRLFFCIVPNNHIKTPIWLAFSNKNNTIATWKQTVIQAFQTHTGFNRSLHQFALNLLLPPHLFSHCYGHCQPRPPAPAPAACRLTYLSQQHSSLTPLRYYQFPLHQVLSSCPKPPSSPSLYYCTVCLHSIKRSFYTFINMMWEKW